MMDGDQKVLEGGRRALFGPERDAVIIDLLERIEARKLSVVGSGKARWDTGWQENLDEFLATREFKALRPKYFRRGLPMRGAGEFFVADDPDYEERWYEKFRQRLFEVFDKFDHIFEFGSGSGHNLAYLAKRFPHKRITGLDWSMPAVEIAHQLGKWTADWAPTGLNVKGRQFDFFNPDYSLEMPPNSAVLTVGALEQTGKGWAPFFDFLVANKPEFCLHIEPLVHLYDPANLVDYTAIKAHHARGFWTGIEDEIARYGTGKMHRTGFGSLVLEGYSQLIWRPK